MKSKSRPVKPKTYAHVRDPDYTREDAIEEWEDYYSEMDYYKAKTGEKKPKYLKVKDGEE